MILLGLYLVAFTFLSVKYFRLAVQLFIITLPSYLIRFSIGPLPSTLLELEFGVIVLVWLVRYAKNDLPVIQTFFKQNRVFAAALGVFFITSVAGIFVSDMWFYSLGQWRAYFLEPLVFFIILIGRRKEISAKHLVFALILSTISINCLGIIQKITGAWYPPSLWDDELFGRVTSFFTSPNAVALYLAPLVALAGIFWADQNNSRKKIILLATGLSIVTLILTKSLGAWLALFAGGLIFLFFIGYKKSTLMALVFALVVGSLPPISSLLLAKEKSGSNRLTLWSYSWNYLSASPKNFVFGAGIRQFFRKVQKPFYTPQEIERLIYPHNVFLNFWTEIGLFGMIGFIIIFILLFNKAKEFYQTNRLPGASLLAALVIFLVHGLVDVPYFKNDLAFLFWILAAIIWSLSLRTTKLPIIEHEQK